MANEKIAAKTNNKTFFIAMIIFMIMMLPIRDES